jgi:Flp pilus assembly protein CpaB
VAPTAVPELVPVVIAAVDLPAGSIIRPSLLTTEQRPSDNVAVRGGYTFSDPNALTGRLVSTDIERGQEVLAPMLVEPEPVGSPSQVTPFGTDLALYVEDNDVAVALPIDRYSGVAYALRPGDRVDMLMTMSFVEVDEEFQSQLPNVVQEVDQNAIAEGRDFLFPPIPAGRLELIPLINQVAYIGPSNPEPVLRPVTQLTLQQVEVLWIGTWRETEAQVLIEPERVRIESEPDMLILGMTAQDALTLKWALEAGLDIDLALRAQGDDTTFITTSVSLPQIVEQTGVTIPDQGTLRLEPPITEIDPPSLPDEPPSGETAEPVPEQPGEGEDPPEGGENGGQ